MNLFSKKQKPAIVELIIVYIKSRLPDRVLGYQPLTKSGKSEIIISVSPSALSFEFEYNTSEEITELTEIDKQHLDNAIVLPALKQLDKDLWALHKEIESKIKEIEEE